MQNGKWSTQILAGADLSDSQNLLINLVGQVVTLSTDATCVGPLEANAAETGPGEAVFVTYSGIGTCICGETPPLPGDYLMAEAGGAIDGRVTTCDPTDPANAGNVIVGQYVQELRNGAPFGPVENEEITVFIFAQKGTAIP